MHLPSNSLWPFCHSELIDIAFFFVFPFKPNQLKQRSAVQSRDLLKVPYHCRGFPEYDLAFEKKLLDGPFD